MPTERELWDVIATNRTRIEGLETEVTRLRNGMHELRSETAGLRYFGEKLTELSEELHQLASKLDTFTRRTLERPTAGGVSAAAAWGSVIVSIFAVLFASGVGH